MLDRTLKSIEPFVPLTERKSRFCLRCAEPATKIVKFSIDGATIIEKYCDKCAEIIKDMYRSRSKYS